MSDTEALSQMDGTPIELGDKTASLVMGSQEQPSEQAGPANIGTMVWVYAVVMFRDQGTMTEKLNQYGSRGWELVQLMEHGTQKDGVRLYRAFFKKQEYVP